MSFNNSNITSEDLVSIIMPTYNSGEYIGRALDSVLKQTYHNWELLIVDDCSTDNTEEVVRLYMLEESRIKYHRLEKNSGAAIARNTAVTLATGRYIAFLDSDDLWYPEKLSKQIAFMKTHNYTFTCTSYTKIDENDRYLNKTINAVVESDYEGILKRNPGNSTIIYDAEVLGKFIIPDIRKRNDYVMWLQVIKKAKLLHGLTEPLGSHRVRSGSLSRKKVNLVGYHWKVYREIEQLSIIKSSYLIIYWIVVTGLKLR